MNDTTKSTNTSLENDTISLEHQKIIDIFPNIIAPFMALMPTQEAKEALAEKIRDQIQDYIKELKNSPEQQDVDNMNKTIESGIITANRPEGTENRMDRIERAREKYPV